MSPDGKRELVRGAVLDDVDDRALRSSIEAAGKDLFVGELLRRRTDHGDGSGTAF